MRPKKRQKLRHEESSSGYGQTMVAKVKSGLNNLISDSYYQLFTEGDWTGAGWSNGKRVESEVGTATAKSYLDQASKEHDMDIATDYKSNKRHLDDIDQDFIEKTKWLGGRGTIASGLIWANRNRRINKLRGSEGMGKQRGIQSDWRTPAKKSTSTVNKISPDGKLDIPSLRGGVQKRIDFSPDPNNTTPANSNPAGTQPEPNSLGAAQMQNGGAEIPVMPVPRNISKIHPDHFTIRLPFTTTLRFNALDYDFKWDNDFPVALIRLNSIYDPLKSTHTGQEFPIYTTYKYGGGATTTAQLVDPNAAAANVTHTPMKDTSIRPQGRDIWAAHFKYYRVLRSDVKVTWINNFCCPMIYHDIAGANPTEAETADAYKAGDATLNSFIVGYELVDENALLSDNADMFRMTKNAERTILPHGTPGIFSTLLPNTGTSETDHNNYYGYICTEPGVAETHFTYVPEAWTYHVENKGEETRWTAVGSNPTIDHHLALRAFHLYEKHPIGTTYRGPVPANVNARYLTVVVQIEYEVQFIECLDSFYKTLQTTTSAAG